MKYRMARQKRDDCSHRATGLGVLLRESGCTGPYFGTPSPSRPASTCLAVGLALCDTASVTCSHIRTHTHTDIRKALYPLIRKGRLRSLLKQSHVATSAVAACFRACEGDFHTADVPREKLMHLPEGPDDPPAVTIEGELQIKACQNFC